jgi:hypothetical protein
LAADDVLVDPDDALDPLDPDEPLEPLEPDDVPGSVVAAPAGSCPDESVDEADEDPDVEPVLSDVLLLVVTGRVSAATRADELRDVL